MAKRVDIKKDLKIKILKNNFGDDVNKTYQVLGVRRMSGVLCAEMKELGEDAYEGASHTRISDLKAGIADGTVVVVR